MKKAKKTTKMPKQIYVAAEPFPYDGKTYYSASTDLKDIADKVVVGIYELVSTGTKSTAHSLE